MAMPQDRSPNDRPPNGAPARMQTTRPTTLLVAAVCAGALGWVLIGNFFGALPRLPWLPPLTMLGLAFVEAVAAVQTKARIERRAGAPPVEPLLVARYVVLAKASALAGALFGGLYAGISAWVLVERSVLAWAGENVAPAVFGAAAAVALAGAGLWLERACRVPSPPGDDSATPGRGGPGARDARDARDERGGADR